MLPETGRTANSALSIGIVPAVLLLAAVQIGVAAGVTYAVEPSRLAGALALVGFTAAGWALLVLVVAALMRRGKRSGRRLDSMRATAERPAVYDRAAGAYVEWYLRQRLDEEIARSSRYGEPFALLLIGSEKGRFAADAATVFTALAGTFREADLVVHLGGLRFVVLLANTDREGTKLAAERLLLQLPLQDVRVGMACYPGDGETWEELLMKAGASPEDLRVVGGRQAREAA